MPRRTKRKRPDETEGLWGMVRDFKDDVFCLRQPVEPEGVRGRGRVQSGPCNPHQLWGLGERSVGIWSSRLQVTKTLGEDPMGEGLGRNVVDQPAGLVNLGATCYLSSLLQCLYHDRAFRRHVYACRRPASGGGAEAQEEEETEASMDVDAASQQLDVVDVTSMAPQSTLVEVLQRIFAELQCGERSAVDPTAFVDMLSLAKDTQQDPQEFNRLLMTHLEPMLGSGSGSGVEGGGGAAAEAEAEADAINVVQRLFIGQLRYVTHCQGCNKKWNRDETYADLQLSVSSPDGPLKTLDACLASFFANEALVEGNQYACANCEDMGNGKQDAYRGIKLVEKKLPQRLTLLLMRFVYDPKLQAKKKLAHAISIPETLDIAPYLEEMDVTMEGGLASVGRGIGDTKYHLRAVLHHSGADNAGHYTADVRRGGDEEDEDLTSAAASPARRGGGIPGEWWHFDDETVRKAKSQTWKKGAGSKSAYMLIYDRVRDASVVATKGGDIPADAMRSVNAVNAKLSAEHGVFVKRKEALEKRVEERKTFHAAHIVVVNPEEASAEEGEGEGDGEERAAAAAAQAASAADRDDEVFVPTTWLKEWVAGRDIIASALDETKATLSGECCTVPISFDDKCLCQCGKLDAMEIRLRCKVLPKAIAEKMMSADARDRTAWKVVRAEKCEECAQKLGESCDTQQRDIMAWQRLIEAIVAASANEQDRENGFWLDKKWVTALKKLQKEKIAGLMQIVKPKLTTAKKKKTSTPQKKKPTPSPSNQPKMTEHFGNASDDAILLKRATGSSSSSSSPSFSSFSSASSSSASAAVASAAGATAHDVHDLTDLTTDLTDAAPAPEAAVVPIRRGLVHAHPPTLNALLRCTCSLGIHVGINVNKSKVWKISGELWEKLKTTFDDGGEVLELPILHDHLQRPQVCETCKQGHATVRETKNLRKQRQEEACLGLERIRSARDVKRTSRVAGHGDLRGGKVGPGEYHVVPVRWLQRWRAKMDQCEVDSSPIDFSGILCEHKKALKSGYFEEQLRLQAALALISYAEEGSASASPYELVDIAEWELLRNRAEGCEGLPEDPPRIMVANGSEPGVLADTMDVIALGEGWCSACSKKAQEKYKKATITYADRSITVFLVKESVDPRSFRQTHSSSGRSIRANSRQNKSHSVSASSTDTLQQFVMKVAQAFDAFDGNLGGFRFWLEHAEPEARWSTIHDYHTGNLASLGIRAGGNLLFKKVILTKDDEAVGIDLACGQMSGVREEGFAGTALGSSLASEGTRPSPTGKKEETVIVAMDIDDNSTDQPWVCHACTLENPSHLKACQACDTVSGLAKHGVSL